MQKVQRRIYIVTSLKGLDVHLDSISVVEVPTTFDNLLLGFVSQQDADRRCSEVSQYEITTCLGSRYSIQID